MEYKGRVEGREESLCAREAIVMLRYAVKRKQTPDSGGGGERKAVN